jgi:hypothetical protein
MQTTRPTPKVNRRLVSVAQDLSARLAGAATVFGSRRASPPRISVLACRCGQRIAISV